MQKPKSSSVREEREEEGKERKEEGEGREQTPRHVVIGIKG